MPPEHLITLLRRVRHGFDTLDSTRAAPSGRALSRPLPDNVRVGPKRRQSLVRTLPTHTWTAPDEHHRVARANDRHDPGMGEHTRGAGLGRSLAASRGDPDAFGAVYAELSPKVLRFFAHRTRHGQVSLDLTAETFAKAFEGRRAFRGHSDEQAAGWLWKIARTELAMYWRHREVEMAAISRLGLDRPLADDDELRRIEDLATVELAGERLEGIYGELSSDHRQVIHLHVVDELGYQEIADRLGLSNDVVRARISRGLRLLAERARSIGMEVNQDD